MPNFSLFSGFSCSTKQTQLSEASHQSFTLSSEMFDQKSSEWTKQAKSTCRRIQTWVPSPAPLSNPQLISLEDWVYTLFPSLESSLSPLKERFVYDSQQIRQESNLSKRFPAEVTRDWWTWRATGGENSSNCSLSLRFWLLNLTSHSQTGRQI